MKVVSLPLSTFDLGTAMLRLEPAEQTEFLLDLIEQVEDNSVLLDVYEELDARILQIQLRWIDEQTEM